MFEIKRIFSAAEYAGKIIMFEYKTEDKMKNVKTLNKSTYAKKAVNAGCGECQASCQSACKTSCTVANQKCEKAVVKPENK